MLRYVAVFDIPDDHTRKKVGDAMEGYGIRVQGMIAKIIPDPRVNNIRMPGSCCRLFS